MIFLDFFKERETRKNNCVGRSDCECAFCKLSRNETPTPQSELSAYMTYELVKNGLGLKSAMYKLNTINENQISQNFLVLKASDLAISKIGRRAWGNMAKGDGIKRG